MSALAKLIFAVSALVLCDQLAAQTYKCVNATGKVTYSGKKCSELGLKDAGEVKDQLNVTPAYRPSAPAAESRRTTAPVPRGPEVNAPAAAAPPPDDPERRCFTVKTAKGTATRCNDRPDDNPPD